MIKNHETQIDQLAKHFTNQQKDTFNVNTQEFPKEHCHSVVVDQDEEVVDAKKQETKKKIEEEMKHEERFKEIQQTPP